MVEIGAGFVRTAARLGLYASRVVAACCVVLLPIVLNDGGSARAQGFSWPWDSDERPRPVPREPMRREPAQPAPPPSSNWSPGVSQQSSSICLRLEQRLVQESQQGGNKAREQLPAIERDLQQAQRDLRRLERELEAADCYEWFLFTKQFRNSRACRKAVNDVDEIKRSIAVLEGRRHDIESTSGRSYQDEIIRELARNNCGSSYQNEARRRDHGGGVAGLWQDEDSGGGSSSGSGFRSLPFATYRTVCVRLCDGYYFPISFSTLPNHFDRDAEACQSKCAAPAQLYYYQNPGGAVDQMIAYSSREQYTKLKTAFLYRKEYVNGCSCKQTEFIPQTTMPGAKKSSSSEAANPPPATTGSTSGGSGRQPQVGEASDPWRAR